MEERDHKPTAELIKRASAIADPDERLRVIGEIKELRRRYAGTNAEFKAPNGQPSGLLAALGDDKLNKESILNYLKNTFREKNMHNPAIDADILLAGKGIKKLTSWGMKNETYKKLFAHIPEMTEKAVFLAEEESNKINSHYKKYNHLACGIEIDGKPHTVHIILGENQGQWYYSHILLDIEKGSLLAGIQHPNPGHPIHASLSNIKDTTLLRLLQADSSKIIDENGEPLPVCFGDKSKKEMSAELQGISFAGDKTPAADYLFLNIKNPLVLNENSFNYYDIDNLNPFIQTLGYDGVVRPYGNEFFAFDPSQIKSVIENEVVLTRKTGTTKFYLHEVEIKEKARSAFKTGMDTSALQAPAQNAFKTATERSAPQASKLIIAKKLNEVKGNVPILLSRTAGTK